jgi:endonuclease/exonuclease/phosphatase (EEP) superfamily protein YafD
MTTFTLDCRCGEQFHVDEANVGKQLRCRRCGNQLAIQRPATQRRRTRRRTVEPAQSRSSSGQQGATKAAPISHEVVVPRPRHWRLAAAVSWGYLGAVSLIALIMWGLGDRTILGTVLLFMGRWVFLLPLIVLVPLMLWLWRRMLIPLAAGALIVVGPIMGFRSGWRRLLTHEAGVPVRVVSFNVDGGRLAVLTLPQLLQLWDAQVVGFQECGDELAAAIQSVPGWYGHASPDLCLMSRYPIRSAEVMDRRNLDRIKQSETNEIGGAGYVVRFVLQGPSGPLRFANIHLETPRKGFEGLMAHDLRRMRMNTEIRDIESKLARAWVDSGSGPLVVLGDFNTPVESRIFQEHWGDLDEAFSVAGFGLGATKRNGWIRVRIDHVLTTDQWRAARIRTGTTSFSDHSPVIADLVLARRN